MLAKARFNLLATRTYPLFYVRINFAVVESSFFLRLLHDRYHTPKCLGKFVHFVLLTGIDARTLQNDRPVGDRLILPGGKGGPRFATGAPISRGNGAGGDPNPWGAKNFMTPAPCPRAIALIQRLSLLNLLCCYYHLYQYCCGTDQNVYTPETDLFSSSDSAYTLCFVVYAELIQICTYIDLLQLQY